ncbi:MAG TPA: ABC transporter ATP-binding protein [Reyranella sp.]|jgi:multiple sugar transport system ATP-binding protein|nr:ABC transporter ATP-binding protein [Reyranella sp.]
MAHIELRNINKKFRRHTALDDLSLDVGDGEFFVLLGPTGAGKTTTLRLIAGLEAPDSGSILIAGEDVGQWSAAERDVALVFQYYSLYPHYTVRQNLEFPLKSRHRRLGAGDVAARVARAAQTLRIEHLLERKTDRLSGGEMQRVSLGRAIVRQPRLFLMDEPLSNLDAKLREILRAELKDLQMKFRATFLYVTHDQVEAMSMGDRIGVLNRGRLVQIGTPHEIYNSPRDTFVATFVGSPAMNLLSGVLHDGKVTVAPGKLEIAVPAHVASRLPPGLDRLTLGVRAEDVVVGPGGGLEGRVYGVENHGVEKIVTLKVDEHSLKATVPAHMAIEVDSAIAFAIDPGKLKFFATQTGVNLVSVKEEANHG